MAQSLQLQIAGLSGSTVRFGLAESPPTVTGEYALLNTVMLLLASSTESGGAGLYDGFADVSAHEIQKAQALVGEALTALYTSLRDREFPLEDEPDAAPAVLTGLSLDKVAYDSARGGWAVDITVSTNYSDIALNL